MNDPEIAAASARRKRKSISTRMRFEVFKRDEFTCQYCGATPPSVVLEVDHVIAVANGGTDDETNLITSCFACNRGKSAVPLGRVRPSMEKQAAQAAEREAQLVGYAAVLEARRKRLDKDVWKVADALWGEGTTFMDRPDYASIQRFLKHLALPEVLEAVDLSWAGARSSGRDRWLYFCGVCWRKIKEKEQ